MSSRKFLNLTFSIILVFSILMGGVRPVNAQDPTPPPPSGDGQHFKGKVTPAERQAAAQRAAILRGNQSAGNVPGEVGAQALGAVPAMDPGGTPDYFGSVGNYAYSPQAQYDVNVTITPAAGDTTGSGAVAVASIVGGRVYKIIVLSGGANYTKPPIITITGSGKGAKARAVIADGAVTSIVVTARGSGFALKRDITQLGSPIIGIRKFIAPLPDIPLAHPDTTTYDGSDYYEISLRQYTQQLHPDLPATTLRGYVQTNLGTDSGGNNTIVPAPIQYMGPIIVAQKDRPVRVKFTNELPTGADGNLFIPVDTTVMGAGMGPDGMSMYTQNRASMHLHGGVTPWISDGTPHQWITPAGESTTYPKGVSVQNVPDMPDPGDGSMTFFYTNQQSARLMFYHDHAYGITRLNVYAGEAAGYLVQDPAEQTLIHGGTLPNPNSSTPYTVPAGVIPASEIPLIIQDKSFVDASQTASQNYPTIARQDPTWNSGTTPGTPNTGDLWFPHVYMPNQNPGDMMGASGVGRWDYGPWFWPPYTGLANGPADNPLYPSVPGEPPKNPGTPNPSLVPEAFMDTMVVNGMAYPYLQVAPKTYRFRILNASNDRTLNLQLYFARSNSTMWNSNGTLRNPNAGEVNMVPAVPGKKLPASWPTDGRDGGVPDPKKVGPSMIQIGNEGGLLPAPVVLPNTPIGYVYNRRDVTVLNVENKTLFLGPAERADVIVDFSKVPNGSKLIMYNDAPAPVPAFDPRYDFYTGDPDQTLTGGAPTTLPGYGPNTRTIMQIQVNKAVTTGSTGFSLANLQQWLPVAYSQTQPEPIVPQAAYNTAFNGNYPSDGFARIQDTQMTFVNGPLSNIDVTNSGSSYTTATVTFEGCGGTGAAATANLVTRDFISKVTVTDGGKGYTTPPTVDIVRDLSDTTGSGATAEAVLTGTVDTITVTNGGSGYKTVPKVTITHAKGDSGSGATATATILGGKVTSIDVVQHGKNYNAVPTVTISGGGGKSAKATAAITKVVDSINVTSGGSGYTADPSVEITGDGSGATATTRLERNVDSITLDSPGTGYTCAPQVTIDGDGSGATAQATVPPITMDMQPKAIQELFETNYGRMNALLGVEIPNSSATTQTTIPYGFLDPPTEIIQNSDPMAPLGTLADGTQIWKITHNGVDTHAIHWHLFNVQLINRVGWDGMVKPPDANELGWKETIRMNPLEDAIVALRPIIPTLPFDIPNSVRPLDTTMPTDPSPSTTGFLGVDPIGQPAAVANHLVNFGWEYVWHCHLLGHEENDMMRPIIIAVAPRTPENLGASDVTSSSLVLTWTDNSLNETAFVVQRKLSTDTAWTTIADNVPASAGSGLPVTYNDTTVATGQSYDYQVLARNTVGYLDSYAPPAIGYPNKSVDSTPVVLTGVVTP